ncbi:MAG: hypothetical protein MZV63_23725 [Marinilabiliales bacterium]|nr:hypothetical protein [Marinilabiliales bacterium]
MNVTAGAWAPAGADSAAASRAGERQCLRHGCPLVGAVYRRSARSSQLTPIQATDTTPPGRLPYRDHRRPSR